MAAERRRSLVRRAPSRLHFCARAQRCFMIGARLGRGRRIPRRESTCRPPSAAKRNIPVAPERPACQKRFEPRVWPTQSTFTLHQHRDKERCHAAPASRIAAGRRKVLWWRSTLHPKCRGTCIRDTSGALGSIRIALVGLLGAPVRKQPSRLAKERQIDLRRPPHHRSPCKISI